jgi:hypothetical protein
MSERFSYVKYDEHSAANQAVFKKKFEELEDFALQVLSKGRWRSELMTQLEYAYMCTGKALRDDQIERTGEVDELNERNNC